MDKAGEATHPLVYVVVLSWNHLEDTLACLRSVVGMDYPNFRLLLVDNASSDGTVSAVRDSFPQGEVLVNERNLGFSAGSNVGLTCALRQGADYVLLLNNDAVVDAAMLTLLVEVAEEEPRRGPLGPRIFYLEPPTLLYSEGARCRPVTLAWHGDHCGVSEEDLPPAPRVRSTDYVAGCCLLLSRRLLEEVGTFDPGFFIYYEELDLCLRAKRCGFQPVCVPAARMWHRESVTMVRGSPWQRYHLARSSVRFYGKHTPIPLLPVIVLYRLGSALRTVLRCLLRRETKAAGAYLRGLWDGVRSLRAPAFG